MIIWEIMKIVMIHLKYKFNTYNIYDIYSIFVYVYTHIYTFENLYIYFDSDKM